MYSYYKLRKFYQDGVQPTENWDREYEADGLQKDDPEEYRKQLFYPLVTKYLEKGKHYLDAGCGLAAWIAFMRARGFDVEGVDNSKKAIALAKQAYPDLPVQTADVLHLPFADNSFDGYMAIGVWEYAEDKTKQVAEEAKRILKTGGYLFLEVPYGNPLRRYTYFPMKSLEYFVRAKLMSQKAVFTSHVFRKGDIRVLLEGMGFEVMEIDPHDLPEPSSHYGLWVDWPILRGKEPYRLNWFGVLIKKIMNSLSPWMIATGIFYVAKKK
ncbi:MAG: class I SAM-dependent methyltransferase [bacterium]|nr:class I SAM-dependent methyltransferase [bacterium]